MFLHKCMNSLKYKVIIMSRATESFLAKLHADVANTLSEQVTREEEEDI